MFGIAVLAAAGQERSLFPGVTRRRKDGRSRGGQAEGATRTLVFVLLRAGFLQLLGGTAGRAPEPAEEEYMQSRGKYVAEEGDAMGRLVAGVFLKEKTWARHTLHFRGNARERYRISARNQGPKQRLMINQPRSPLRSTRVMIAMEKRVQTKRRRTEAAPSHVRKGVMCLTPFLRR